MTKRGAKMSNEDRDLDEAERDFGGQCDAEDYPEAQEHSLFECFLVAGFSVGIILFVGVVFAAMFLHWK